MDIVLVRDWVLVIWGIVSTATAIAIIIVAIKFNRKMGSILDSATTAVDTIKNSTTLISEMVLEPISSICSWIKGGYGIFAAITRFLQDKQDKGEEK